MGKRLDREICIGSISSIFREGFPFQSELNWATVKRRNIGTNEKLLTVPASAIFDYRCSTSGCAPNNSRTRTFPIEGLSLEKSRNEKGMTLFWFVLSMRSLADRAYVKLTRENAKASLSPNSLALSMSAWCFLPVNSYALSRPPRYRIVVSKTLCPVSDFSMQNKKNS